MSTFKHNKGKLVEQSGNWISRKDKLPPYGEEVEVSFDGKESEGTGRYIEEAKCMLAYGDSGFGRFPNEFEDIENKLVLNDVTHWRPAASLREYIAEGFAEDELVEEKDFELIHQVFSIPLGGNKGKWITCANIQDYEEYKPDFRRIIARRKVTKEEGEKPTNIPDGENDWTIGADTFSRKEVFKLLYTQRAMIANDLKQALPPYVITTIGHILENPRKPLF